MSSSAVRGAMLIAVAVVLGFLILRGVADRDQVPLVTGPVTTATPTADPLATSEAVALTTPTPEISAEDARPAGQVRVLVANGTEESGQAARLSDRLRNQGFNTRDPANANPRDASVIYYRPGFAPEAVVVRDLLGPPTPIAPMPEPDPAAGSFDLADVDVFVWVGDDELATG